MSPQLLWTIAGLVLTVLTLGGVTISSYQSMDASKSKLVASEVGNVATAAKLWMANNSTDGTFTGISATAMTKYIPDLVVDGDGKFTSKTVPAITIAVAADTDTSKVIITAAGIPADQQAPLNAALTGRACTVSASGASQTYTCKG